MADPAPLFDDIARAPDGGRAFWLRAGDGVRLRAALWDPDRTGRAASAPARGSVLMFPGRTEYIEKYGPAATEFVSRGFGFAVVDWRGQGLADRLHPNPIMGHIGDFAAYQRDVDAFVDLVRGSDLPRPFYLIGHSMGGCIGLRALMRGLEVAAACFSAPMWGIQMPAAMAAMARPVSFLAQATGFGGRAVPGGDARESYVIAEPFKGNLLTGDRDMYDFLRAQVRARPDLALGAPSMGWLHAALREMAALRMRPSPPVPALCFVGDDEAIVSPGAIERRMMRWPEGRLVVAPGARHEIMMGSDTLRDLFFDQTTAFFDAAPGAASAA